MAKSAKPEKTKGTKSVIKDDRTSVLSEQKSASEVTTTRKLTKKPAKVPEKGIKKKGQLNYLLRL